MTAYRFAASRLVLLGGSAACLVSPFLFWVGRGMCGWTCYSPVGFVPPPGPSRLDDEHIGWHQAVAPSCALVLLGLAVLVALGLRHRIPTGVRARRVALGVATSVATWTVATAVQLGTGRAGLEKGGFVGAVGATAIATVLLIRLITTRHLATTRPSPLGAPAKSTTG